MCWINWFILINLNKDKSFTLLNKMNKRIKHRWPDDEWFSIEKENINTIWLWQVRLSIIDLSDAGHQPMFYNKSFWASNKKWKKENINKSNISITFNGEIYNFKEIKKELKNKWYIFSTKTDTEIILASYLEWWKKCIEKFNGMWSFVIYDKRKNILFWSRDRFWKKPLKYYFDWNDFIFSSELKAILEHKIKRQIDLDAINHYLTLQYVPSPKTWFKNIFKLPHAHNFIFDIKKKSLNIYKYFDLSYKEKLKNISEKKLKEKIEKKLEESIKLRLISDVEVWAFLSWWVDSSAIVAFASKYKKKLKTFTIKFDEKEFDESKYAKAVSNQYKTKHKEFLVKSSDMLNYIEKLAYQYEEPYADSSGLPTFILAEKTSKYVKVVLNWDGWDENFGWYDKYNIHLKSKKLHFLPFKKIIAYIFKFLYKISWKKLLLYKLFLYFYTLWDSLIKRHLNYTNYFDTFSRDELFKKKIKKKLKENTFDVFTKVMQWKENLKYLDKILYLDFNTYLPDDLMVKIDIATMANWLESRSPLLNYNFVEYTARIPYEYKIKWRNRKIIFKKMLGKYLSKKILYRKKKWFSIPINYWLRNELKSYVNTIILDKDLICLKLFKKDKLLNLLKEQSKGINNWKKLWTLMMLNLWYKKYF